MNIIYMNPKQSSLSLAMCTYNGERHLQSQLASIASQTRPPDEMIVFDDASTDGTVELLQRFSKEVSFKVSITSHAKNVGSTENFGRCIAACTGDIIALADQDDVWHPEKLAALDQALLENVACGLVCSDAEMVDENLQSLGYRLWDAIGLSRTDRELLATEKATSVLSRKFAVTGMTMAFRSSYKPLILPFHASWIHDGWIAFCIASVSPLCFVDRALVQYRQHSRQQVGEKKRSLLETYRFAKKLGTPHLAAHLEMARSIRSHLNSASPEWAIPPILIERLDRKILYLEDRLRLRSNRLSRIRALRVWLSGDYSEFAFGWKSMVQDLVA